HSATPVPQSPTRSFSIYSSLPSKTPRPEKISPAQSHVFWAPHRPPPAFPMTDRSGAHAIASTRGWRRPPTPSPSGADQFTRRLAIGRGAENERVAACPEWLGDTLIPPLLPMCSTCLFRASREESAILLGAELREVGASRRWIRFEVEPMSGMWWRRG